MGVGGDPPLVILVLQCRIKIEVNIQEFGTRMFNSLNRINYISPNLHQRR